MAAGPALAAFATGLLLTAGPAVAACAPAAERRPLHRGGELIAAAPAGGPGPATAPRGPSGEFSPTYADRLATTPLGWPRLERWCVWVQPPGGEPGAERWETRWREAVEHALARWGEVVRIERVEREEAAHVRVLRRRPPLRWDAAGRTRASHGRALLRLEAVERGGRWRHEPRVDVLLGPGQRLEALRATAVHELGHAFGLWGHSDSAEDAMAAVPGPVPVSELSRRDRATMRWLQRQETRLGEVIAEPPAPAGR